MLPKDPVILLSYVNTQLRDYYPSLEEMCISMDVKITEVVKKLKEIDYEYNKALNKFV